MIVYVILLNGEFYSATTVAEEAKRRLEVEEFHGAEFKWTDLRAEIKSFCAGGCACERMWDAQIIPVKVEAAP